MSASTRKARHLLHALSPTQLLVLSFLGLILVGTAGLLVLPGLYTGPELGFVDALFTATSAVCVTGLIVVDTATYFTPLGQAWILALIQAGGLGILTFTTLALSALGRRAPLGVEEATGGHAILLGHVTHRGLVGSVVLATFTLEAAGTLGLWMAWQEGMGSGRALWNAAFHAVSAFCNAGFSIFSDSLAGFADSPPVLAVVGGLVILGGLGFIVLEDLRTRYVLRTSARLALHTKLVLTTTAGLLLAGTLLFLTFEWHNELAGHTLLDRLAGAGFMSITPRTAGFNTVEYADVTNASLFLTIVLMLVGGSPGSAAGGFKTVAIILLALLFWSRLTGERRVSAFRRTIPAETIHRAVGLVVGGLVLLGIGVFLLMVVEGLASGSADRNAFVRLVFEAHSAFGTVGLSMGATPDLSAPGRVIVTGLMFLGRLGPPVVVAAMARSLRRRGVDLRYGEEDVVLG